MVDIKTHNYISLSMSEFQTNYCKDKKLDPEDPRCARLTFSDSFSKIETFRYSPLNEIVVWNA